MCVYTQHIPYKAQSDSIKQLCFPSFYRFKIDDNEQHSGKNRHQYLSETSLNDRMLVRMVMPLFMNLHEMKLNPIIHFFVVVVFYQ